MLNPTGKSVESAIEYFIVVQCPKCTDIGVRLRIQLTNAAFANQSASRHCVLISRSSESLEVHVKLCRL